MDNIITVGVEGKSVFVAHRDILRESNGIAKNIDIQTIAEIFNERVYRVTKDHLAGPGVVVDVGAHIGTFSLFVSALGANTIYALEPNPDNFRQLEKNIALNNLEQLIYPIQVALWPEEHILVMENFYSDSRVTDVVPLESEISKGITPTDVDDQGFSADTMTLDMLLDTYSIDEISVLKMDIEWSEYEVLPSLDDETMRKIRYLVLEFHGTDAATFGKLIAHLTRCFCVETLGSYERGGFLWCRRY